MNYRELLIKYIDHVGYREGVTFLSDGDSDCFTEEEFAELQKLDKESEQIHELNR